jgi:hypothetical protein
MNYKIITDEKELRNFIDFLPELKENECYYICLFSRAKYCKEGGLISSDKQQLKRVVASKKDHIIDKIRQMECKVGSYKTKKGLPVPQESLALYITINPRCQVKASHLLQKKLLDTSYNRSSGFNINAEAMSALQKSKSRSNFIVFDLDVDKEVLPVWHLHEWIWDIVGYTKALRILITRGGYHVLVDPTKVIEHKRKTWYNDISKNQYIDQKGDMMIPVPGTHQGGFTPKFY